MDTYRGNFGDHAELGEDGPNCGETEIAREAPPSIVGQDERRMQVRAYNHWAGLLDNRNFPSIEDLEPTALPDFGPYSVLLDFTAGIANPSIRFLGEQLAEECGTTCQIETLADVPSRSLLSRITDHYMQILANQAPIGFEAEFVNQRENTILYRGILLPFSSDDTRIDFIYGVINWKELADQTTTDALLLEIDQALDASAPDPRRADALTDWADGPSDFSLADLDHDDVLDLAMLVSADFDAGTRLPSPAFGNGGGDRAATAPQINPETMGLADWLAAARQLAAAARGSEDRTRHALYAAIGRAYDFALAAARAPQEFAALVAEAGLAVQDRAPMTPVVKLVFGADYDKTRLTEYASALARAHRIGLVRGELARYLAAAPGGLKGVVSEERRVKRTENGQAARPRGTPSAALARKLRQLAYVPLDQVAEQGREFTVLIARRLPSGAVVVLGEVPNDPGLLERAARTLID